MFQALLQGTVRAREQDDEAPYTAEHLRRQLVLTLIAHR